MKKRKKKRSYGQDRESEFEELREIVKEQLEVALTWLEQGETRLCFQSISIAQGFALMLDYFAGDWGEEEEEE